MPVVLVVLVVLVLVVWMGVSWWRPSKRSTDNMATGKGPGGVAGAEATPRVQAVRSGSGTAPPREKPSPGRPDAGPAKSPVEESAPLAVETTAVNLGGTSGGGKTFGLLVLKSGGPVERLEYSCSPLKPEGDAPPHPAPEVKAQPEAKGLPPDVQRDILLEFELPSLSPGKYSCRLFIRDPTDGGKRASVPVTLAVKHDWPRPLFILILGVVAGAIVSNYRTIGRPRDEAYQRLGRLRSEMNSDVKLAPEFRDYIEQSFLAEAEMYTRNGQWEQATPRLEGAEKAWGRWLRYRDQWVELLDYVAKYERTIDGMSARARTARTCRDDLHGLRRGVATMDEPKPLREKLNAIRDWLQTYRDLSDDLKAAEAIGVHLPPDRQEKWQADIEDLREKLDALDVRNGQDVADLWKSIKDLRAGAISKQALKAAKAAGAQSPAWTTTIPAVPAQGLIQGAGGQRSVASPMIPLPGWMRTALSPEYAGARLTYFHWSAWIATMIVLVWTGMEQLYANKPTFGSGADYFAMVGWGFGSNAASSTIVQAFNGAPKSSPR